MSLRGILVILLLWCSMIGCRSPEERAARNLARGKEHLAKQDYARAILQLKNAAELQPSSAEVQYELGVAYLATGDPRTGIDCLQRALRLKPNYPPAELKLAELAAMRGSEQLRGEAARRLQKILASDAITQRRSRCWPSPRCFPVKRRMPPSI